MVATASVETYNNVVRNDYIEDKICTIYDDRTDLKTQDDSYIDTNKSLKNKKKNINLFININDNKVNYKECLSGDSWY